MKSLRDEILLCRVMLVGRWACSRRKSLHLTREVARSDGRREAGTHLFSQTWGRVQGVASDRRKASLRPQFASAPSLLCILQNLLRPHFAFCKICSVPILHGKREIYFQISATSRFARNITGEANITAVGNITLRSKI